MLHFLRIFAVGLPVLMTWFLFESLGGYPTNDDPYYGRPAQVVAEQSRVQVYRQEGVLAASSVAHFVIGGWVSKLIGFSYRSLFLAVIVQLWAAAGLIYLLAKDAKCAPWFCVFWAALFLFNPLCFGSAFTFMTDGPAVAWAIAAIYAFRRGITSSKLVWFIAGSMATAVAFWMRQTHILMLGFPIVTIGMQSLRRREWVEPTKSLVATILPAALAVLLFESGLVTGGNDQRLGIIFPDRFDYWQLMINTYGVVILFGFLLLPILPLMLNAMRASTANFFSTAAIGSLVFTLLMFMPLVATQGRACLTSATGTLIQNAHLGPILLSDFDTPGRWSDMGDVTWPAIVWQLLTVASIANAGVLVFTLVDNITFSWFRSDEHHQKLVILLSLAVTMVPAISIILSIRTGVLDRYWMLLFPMVFAIVPELISGKRFNCRKTITFASFLLVAQFGLSFIFVHDFLAWNQTRWKQFERWVAAGELPESIDGGRDMNAWYRTAEDVDTMPREGDDSGWWRGRATKALSIGPRDGWREIGKLPWNAWATGQTHQILMLKKIEALRDF